MLDLRVECALRQRFQYLANSQTSSLLAGVDFAVLILFNTVLAGTKMTRPKESIRLSGSSWEEQVHSLVKDVFEPSGFTVELFTRVPYLCEGDLFRDFYVLDDALFVLKSSGKNFVKV